MEVRSTGARPGRLTRSANDRVLTGVAGGLAERLGVESLVVRLAFVLLSLAAGVGLSVYLLAYLASSEPTGGEAEARLPTVRQAVAFGLVILGVLLLFRQAGLWFGDALAFPLVLLTLGSAVLWTRGDEQERERWRRSLARLPQGSRGVLVGGGRVVRLAVGVGLMLAGLAAFAASGGVRTNAPLAVTATMLGLAVMGGPWLWGVFRQLSDERHERIRGEERASVAAHLHDSVLQTLALIQRSDDPRAMATLARSQERELRDWLYGGEATADPTLLSTAMNEVAAEVERAHRIRIDVVTVGDRNTDEGVRALVLAAREAMTNAARHAGVDRLSVYVEVTPSRVTAFVRDKGRGFDPDTVAADRHGIVDSIVTRMARVGGSATIVSARGRGCEVRLVVPVSSALRSVGGVA
jgi:signal transduction histidine kinase